jgi:hypothetical protein
MSQAGVLTVQTSGGPVTETLTGNTGGPVGPDAAFNINIIGAGGVLVTGFPGSNTLEITDSSTLLWNLTAFSEPMVSNNGYICDGGGALVLSLPATSAFGDILEITLDGSSSFQIAQNGAQQIRIGSLQTTSGVAGSITTTAQGNSLRMVCQIADTKWNVLSSMGNFTIV